MKIPSNHPTWQSKAATILEKYNDIKFVNRGELHRALALMGEWWTLPDLQVITLGTGRYHPWGYARIRMFCVTQA